MHLRNITLIAFAISAGLFLLNRVGLFDASEDNICADFRESTSGIKEGERLRYFFSSRNKSNQKYYKELYDYHFANSSKNNVYGPFRWEKDIRIQKTGYELIDSRILLLIEEMGKYVESISIFQVTDKWDVRLRVYYATTDKENDAFGPSGTDNYTEDYKYKFDWQLRIFASAPNEYTKLKKQEFLDNVYSFTPDGKAGVQGFIETNQFDQIESAICFIFADLSDAEKLNITDECFFRMLGLIEGIANDRAWAVRKRIEADFELHREPTIYDWKLIRELHVNQLQEIGSNCTTNIGKRMQEAL